MHESFDKDDAASFTRPWFAWANSNPNPNPNPVPNPVPNPGQVRVGQLVIRRARTTAVRATAAPTRYA